MVEGLVIVVGGSRAGFLLWLPTKTVLRQGHP